MIEINRGVFGLLSNIFIYTVTFLLFFLLTKKSGKLQTFLFIPYWLTFEIIINTYHFSFPWLTLGNLFATHKILIQWYSITSVLGGSLWILFLGWLIYKGIFTREKSYLKYSLIVFIIPIIFSVQSLSKFSREKNETQEIIAYNNKLDSSNWSNDGLVYKIVKNIDKKKQYKSLILPEQTLRGMSYNKFKFTQTYDYFHKLINSGVVENVVVGTTGLLNNKKMINSAFVITKDSVYYKVKKKLVPYVEYIYPILYPIFSKRFFQRNVDDQIDNIINETGISPIICYESLYPFFTSDQSKNANYIYLLSSERFMNNNKFAMKQYNNIISLRAIENRKHIIKVSNSGISTLINLEGSLTQKNNKTINYFNIPIVKNRHSTIMNSMGLYLNIAAILILLVISKFLINE